MNTLPLTPQDKAINHSPIPQVWELFEHEGIFLAHKVDWVQWYKAADAFEVSYNLKGKSAHYCICSNDASITRSDALEWAKVHHAGGFKTYHIDLAPCNIESKRK